MKTILAVLALVLTSTLFAQEPRERPGRDPRSPGVERQEPRPRIERLRALRDRMQQERQRTDAREEQRPGTDRRRAQGEAPRHGRGKAGHARGHGHRGGMDRVRAESVRRAWQQSPQMDQVRERVQRFREAMVERMHRRAAIERRMEASKPQRAPDRARARTGRSA